ncbi:MAG TPA: CehA/McbA family metallohydrolase [Anaerolineaceae bacterium]|nr:CehA/McbA family metallohydrolase [Anaerolineaceae bacterium]
MQELVVNLHMHTWYSDGHATHAELAEKAIQTGLDAIIVTDHNVWVNGIEGYVQKGKRRVLVLIGEEIHDPARQPQKSHLLVFGANREMCTFSPNIQNLVDQVRHAGGLSFIAHPDDPALTAFGETDITWEDWQVQGYTGIELWNSYSETKTVIHNFLDGLFYAFFPRYIARGPIPATILTWDHLLASGKKVVAIGGSDAHALRKSAGPLHRTIFPYEFHFRGVNTHLWIPDELTGDASIDRQAILDALRLGHAFIGHDLHESARDFRFTAQGKDQTAWMGDEILARGGVTMQVHLPHPAECLLLKDGKVIKTSRARENITHITTEPGVYRIEVYQQALGRRRGWIYSNPIYVR